MKSKAQEWADNEGKRQERAQRLREELMSMRDESDAPKLTLEPEGPRFGVTWILFMVSPFSTVTPISL